MDRNRRFAELAGLPIHDFAGDGTNRCVCGAKNFMCCPFDPDFTADARLVLEVMKDLLSSEEFNDFYDEHLVVYYISDGRVRFNFNFDLLFDRTGKLLELAIEWLEGRERRWDRLSVEEVLRSASRRL